MTSHQDKGDGEVLVG